MSSTPTILELADQYAKDYFMGRPEDARKRLQAAIMASDTKAFTELKAVQDELAELRTQFDSVIEQRNNLMIANALPAAYAVRTIGGKKFHCIHSSKGSSDKWLEFRRKEQARGEQYEQVALTYAVQTVARLS